MRFAKALLWFFVGFALAGVAVVANATTIYTSWGWTGSESCSQGPSSGKDNYFNSPAEVCAYLMSGHQARHTRLSCNKNVRGYTMVSTDNKNCHFTFQADGYANPIDVNMGYGTLNSSCPDGQKVTQTGQCVAACPTTFESMWIQQPAGSSISGSYCIGGCGYTYALDLSQPDYFKSATATWMKFTKTGSGDSCSGSSSSVPSGTPNPPNTPDKSPPCASGEGVIASATSGAVKCVPSSTPGADTPKVTRSSSTETKSDGSAVQTTVTNTCAGEGSCSSTTTTTVTNNSAGQPGLAGTPGTSTKTTNGTGGANGDTPDLCAKNPSLQICKGGMNEEATQKQVLAELKRLSTPDASDDSSIKGASHSTESQTALEAEDKKVTDAATGVVKPIAAQQSSWETAMSSGWFSPIPQTGCSPINQTFAGREWNFDPCPVAEKVSQIGGYGMWFMLVVGTFVMLTGGNKQEGA